VGDPEAGGLFESSLDNTERLYLKKKKKKPGAVAHACNFSYLGVSDRKNQSLKPAQAKS
jgi:hypothetical protein